MSSGISPLVSSNEEHITVSEDSSVKLKPKETEKTADAAKQLEERIKKTVAFLIRYGSSTDSLPPKIPDFLSNAIHAIRNIAAQRTSELERSLNESVLKNNELATQVDQLTQEMQNLQLALENVEQTASVEAEYGSKLLKVRIAELEEEQMDSKQLIEKLASEAMGMKSKLSTSEMKCDQLSVEVHSLTNHIQHKMSEISQNHEIDRQMLSNWVVQFLTRPDKRLAITNVMTGTLGFTQEQQERLVALCTAENTELPISPLVHAAPEPNRSVVRKSLSDRWVSFLLQEADSDQDHPPIIL
jgi:chromosome segregation ATPase